MEIKLKIISFTGVGRGGVKMLGAWTIKKQEGNYVPSTPHE